MIEDEIRARYKRGRRDEESRMERFRLIAVAAWLPILGGAVLANALEGPARVAAVVVVVVAVILQLFAGRKALHLQRRLPGWNPY